MLSTSSKLVNIVVLILVVILLGSLLRFLFHAGFWLFILAGGIYLGYRLGRGKRNSDRTRYF